MRIGFDAWGLSGELLHTGMGQYSRHLLETLAGHWPHLQVVAYGAPGEQRPDWLPPAVGWRAPAGAGPRKTAAVVSRLAGLRTAAAADRLDLFHAPAVHVRPSLPPVPAVACPLVATVHDLIPLTFYGRDLPARLRLFYRWNLRRALQARAVITVSEHARREILAHGGVPSEQVTAVPNGVAFEPNADRAALARLGVRVPYILYAGSYEPRKNLAAALGAYGRVAAAGFAHAFVGVVEARSGHAAAVHARLTSLRLGERVRLVHSLPDPDLRALYTHAEALFFPSLAEGFGFPPLQAAACSVPVVASDIAPVRETMGDAAEYVDPRSEDSMAAGLLRVLADGGVRRRLSEAGRGRVAGYTWQRSVERHLEVYRRVAGKPEKPALPDRIMAS